jgi:FAD/FMN-containing dehydrogenase
MNSVGVFGGYSQGGGHGPLISTYGPGADQILSAEVVTADGQFVTASSTENTDLFWALRGGGGGTWGVVTSMTVRGFPSTEATVAVFTFSTSNTTSSDTFWAGVKGYWDNIPTFADAGVYCYFFVFPFAETTFYATFFAPNRTIAGVEALASPFLDSLAALDIPITPSINTYPSIYLGWKANFPQEAVGTDNVAIGSRLFPRDNWADPALNNATFDAWSASGQEGSVLIGMNCAAPNHWGVDNAVLPAWRNSVLHSMQGTSWVEGANGTTKVAACELLTQRQALWKSLTPNSGAYLNECDIRDEDFQQDYYGANYPRLLSIKHAVDPWNVFWAKTAVGSEVLSVVSNPIEEAIGDENGRLCYT